jgi:hypothetical protein
LAPSAFTSRGIGGCVELVNKTKRISVYLTKEEYEMVVAIAKRTKNTLSQTLCRGFALYRDLVLRKFRR